MTNKENINMKRSEKVLIGYTRNSEVVFANITQRGGEFTASFETSYPKEIGIAEHVAYYEEFITDIDCMTILEELQESDCRPSELPQVLASKVEIEETFGISLYTEVFTINNYNDIYFLDRSIGQKDHTNDMKAYTNIKLAGRILNLWRTHNLREVGNNTLDALFRDVQRQNSLTDDRQTIQHWLETEQIELS